MSEEPSQPGNLDTPLPPPAPPAPLVQPELSFGKALLYASGNFGSGVFYAFNNFVLSLYLQGLGASAVVLGLLSSTRSFEGAIIQPIVGSWSDRTWTRRLGRRRPFIVAFVPLCAVFLVVTGFVPVVQGAASSLGLTPSAFVLIAGGISIFLFTVTFNISVDPYTALLPDITPPHQRGHINGLVQAVGAVGQMALLIFSVFLFSAVGRGHQATGFFVLFPITAAALVLFFVPTVLGVHEPRELVHGRGRRRYAMRDYLEGLRGELQVQRYFAVQFFLWFGINAISPFITPYAKIVIHLDNAGALLLSFILLGSTALFNWPAGALADRLGVKRVFLFGMIVLAGSSLAGIFVRAPLALYLTLFIAGIGNAAQTGSSYPLLTRLARPDRMGLYTGLNSAITSIAAPASAVITGTLIDRFSYIAMFPFVAAMFLLALIPLSLLDLEAGEARVTAELRAESLSPVAE